MQKLERVLELTPAWDKRSPDTSKNYGIEAVKILFVLKGEHGAVHALFSTNWYLPHVQRERRTQSYEFDRKFDVVYPTAWDLGYHADSAHPVHPWQREQGTSDEFFTSPRECPFVPSGKCYYDGSSLHAERLVPILLEKGSGGVWRALEHYYNRVFGERRE